MVAQIKPQITSEDGDEMCRRILRQPMQNRSKEIEYYIETAFYNGPKQPEMPSVAAMAIVPSLAFLATQRLSMSRSIAIDCDFIKSVIEDPAKCCDFNGFHTRIFGKPGRALNPMLK